MSKHSPRETFERRNKQKNASHRLRRKRRGRNNLDWTPTRAIMGDADAATAARLADPAATVGGEAYACLVRAGCRGLGANKAELNKINALPPAW